MLQSIRDRIQGWFAWTIIVVLGIAFALWGIDRFISSMSAPSQAVAKVNGEVISTHKFASTYERLKRQLQFQLGGNFVLNQQTEARLKQQTLQTLITNTLLTQAALKAGYRITPGQIDAVLASTPEFQSNGRFSADKFMQVLNALMFTEESFIEQLRSDMLLNQLQVGFTASAFALSSDVNTAYRLLNQTRDGGYLVVPHTNFAKQVTASDEEAQAYYQKNKNQFMTPEQISLAYIVLSLSNLQANISVSDVELKQYYAENSDSFALPARWQIAHILVQVPANAKSEQVAQAQSKISTIAKQLTPDGSNFAQLAQKYSDDVVSAKNGGTLPWFNGGTTAFGVAFETAVQNLKVGQVSQPVRTQYGFELIKLLAMQPKQMQSLDKVRDQVKTMLMQQKAQQAYANQSEQLANLTYSNASTLTAAANALGVKIQTTPLFDRNGGKTGIISNPKIIAAAFSPSVLAQGNNSDVIQLDPNTQIVVRVQEHNPAKVKPFEVVKSDIVARLMAIKEAQAGQVFGNQLLSKLQAGSNPEQVAKENNLDWKKFTDIGRHYSTINENILNKVFLTARPKAGMPLPMAGFSLPNGDYAIVVVSKVTDGDVSKMTALQKQAFQQKLATNFGQVDYKLFIAQQKQKAKIKIEKNNLTNAQVDVS